MIKKIRKLLKIMFGRQYQYEYNSEGKVIKFWSGAIESYYDDLGRSHRINGPAYKHKNGDVEYCVHGVLHRTDGPALIFNNYEFWYIHGVNMTDEINQWLIENNISLPFSDSDLILFQMRFYNMVTKYGSNRIIHMHTNELGETHRSDGPAVFREDGSKEWWQNNQLHREHGPAVLYANGDMEFWVNDDLHREHGPAVLREIYKAWWFKGRLHRTDGPAVIDEGRFEWWINDINLTDDVNDWMKSNNIEYPFSNEILILFQLKFVY